MTKTETTTKLRRMPRGFRAGHDGSLACPHRDVSCCEGCASAYPEIVDVMGAHFWISDPNERAALSDALDRDAIVEQCSVCHIGNGHHDEEQHAASRGEDV